MVRSVLCKLSSMQQKCPERQGSQLVKQWCCACNCHVPVDLSDPMTLKLNLLEKNLPSEGLTLNSNLGLIAYKYTCYTIDTFTVYMQCDLQNISFHNHSHYTNQYNSDYVQCSNCATFTTHFTPVLLFFGF